MPRSNAVESSVCVDASLVVKWLVSEEDSAKALNVLGQWIEGSVNMIAPVIIDYEVASVLRKVVSRGLIDAYEARERLCLFESLPIRRLHSPSLLRRAWETACRHRMPTVYDASYVALAEITGTRLYTCDEALVSAMARGGEPGLIVNPLR